MLRHLVLAGLVTVSLVGFASMPAAADSGPGNGGNRARLVNIEGILVGVNAQTRVVVIRRFNGAIVTLRLSPFTKIERNDRHVGLWAFRAGDRAQARILNGAVVKFEAIGR
jgi:hypothetical protein